MHVVSSALDEGPLALPQTGHRIDRHDADRQREDWLAEVWRRPETRVLRVAGDRVRRTADGARPVLEPAHGELPDGAVYLGEVPAADIAVDPAVDASGGVHVVAVEEPEDDHADAAAEMVSTIMLRRDAAELAAVDAGLLTQAVAILAWHRAASFCTACGAATEIRSSGWMRACPQCGAQSFPRTDPAVITAVVDRDDRLLLGSAVRWDASRYSTFAGFVEAGESVEQAVAREVAEEAGVDVVEVRYLGSQSWPFPRSLMLGHLAVVDDAERAVADREEIRHVRWFTREELAAETAAGRIGLPPRSSISRALIEHWHGGRIEDADPRTGPQPASDSRDSSRDHRRDEGGDRR